MQTTKSNYMQQIAKLSLMAGFLFVLAACGGRKDEKGGLNDKKAELEKLRGEKIKLEGEITKLEEEVARLDPASKNAKAFLISVAPVNREDFSHFIELQGNVESDNISYISPRGMGGQVKAIYIREGQYVKKGQLVLKLDDAIQRQAVTAAQKQLEALKTQLSFAKNIYDRQKNLWDQGIGTEVQMLTAKNNVESLEKQLAGSQEGIKTAIEQLKTANVYSDVNGLVEKVNVRVGELFQGATMAGPQIQVVNNSALKVVIRVPENYNDRVRVGNRVEIEIPDAGKTYMDALISLSGQLVDPTTRSFNAEVRIPGGGNVRANQVAKVKIRDYSAPNAFVVPVNVVQTDESGKYVYVMVKEGSLFKARKRKVNLGEIFGDKAEVRLGLTEADQIITEGYQNVYDGQVVTTGTTPAK